MIPLLSLKKKVGEENLRVEERSIVDTGRRTSTSDGSSSSSSAGSSVHGVHTGGCAAEGERNSNQDDGLILMSAMVFTKLQICYFGNMALRSSLLFAVVGSFLLAVTPALIIKEGGG